MYGIYTYIWLILMVNVGKYTIHGSSGNYTSFDENSLLLLNNKNTPIGARILGPVRTGVRNGNWTERNMTL